MCVEIRLVNKQKITDITVSSTVVAVVTFLVNLGLFVTFQDMYAYAAPKDSIAKMEQQLDRIERLTIKLCVKNNIEVPE